MRSAGSFLNSFGGLHWPGVKAIDLAIKTDICLTHDVSSLSCSYQCSRTTIENDDRRTTNDDRERLSSRWRSRFLPHWTLRTVNVDYCKFKVLGRRLYASGLTNSKWWLKQLNVGQGKVLLVIRKYSESTEQSIEKRVSNKPARAIYRGQNCR